MLHNDVTNITVTHLSCTNFNAALEKLQTDLTVKSWSKTEPETTVLNRNLARLLNSKWVDIKEITNILTAE